MAKKRIEPDDDQQVADQKRYGKPKNFDPDFRGPLKNRSCTDIVCLLLLIAFLAGWGVISYFALNGQNPTSPICLDEKNDFTIPGNCMPYVIPSVQSPVAVFPGWVPNGSKALGKYLNAREITEKIFQDFRATWWMILVGFLAAMIISFIWIVIMRWVAGPMVWLGLLSVIGVLGYGTYYCFITWHGLRQKNGVEESFEFSWDAESYLTRQGTWLAFGIIAAVVLGIVLLITLFLRNRIRLAIALLQEASKGVSSMMFTLLWPVVPFVLQVIVFSFWGLLAVLFSSAGKSDGVLIDRANGTQLSNQPCIIADFQNDTTRDCVFSSYQSGNMYTYFHLYNIFGLFWLGFFVVGLSEVSLAGAFATFYWTREKAKNMPMFPLAGSVGRCFRYHLGSVAFGSLIIAIVRFVRYLLEQLDKKLKQSQLGFARFLLKCCACCLWCLESFLKFINRNAYIMIAIYGKNFCRSAKDAFSLLMRNIIRVVVLDKVTDFLLFLGKMVIVSAIGIFAVHFFDGAFDNIFPEFLQRPSQMNYIAVPLITVIIGSYFITSAFFGVYAMAVDTLFLCFLEDLERNDGTLAKPYFMSKNLMRILGKKNKKEKTPKIASTESL
ncbi:Choline transporter-like protein 5 [Hypsibius exemplaris]|uniref:Choline transporter-like protein n=1 Tax=Hypsibius exemplaris TaxID=2072580 RepID=A0A9X6RN94_HYPEX|nr:Choline transporter-like protein 5 [Hypsibius exemplaris]